MVAILTTPIATTILNEIEARMASITILNGYNTDVKKITRGQMEPFKGYDLPAINIWPSNLTADPMAYDQEKRTLPVFIEIHDLTRDEPFSTVAEKLASDIVIAINRATTAKKVSDSVSADLGELVEEVVFKGYDYEIGQGQKPFCGALVRFEIIHIADKNSLT